MIPKRILASWVWVVQTGETSTPHRFSKLRWSWRKAPCGSHILGPSIRKMLYVCLWGTYHNLSSSFLFDSQCGCRVQVCQHWAPQKYCSVWYGSDRDTGTDSTSTNPACPVRRHSGQTNPATYANELPACYMLLEMLVKSIGLPHKVLPNVGSCVPVTPALHPPTPSITDVHMDFITPHPLSSLVAGQRLPVVDVSTLPVALCIEMFSEILRVFRLLEAL